MKPTGTARPPTSTNAAHCRTLSTTPIPCSSRGTWHQAGSDSWRPRSGGSWRPWAAARGNSVRTGWPRSSGKALSLPSRPRQPSRPWTTWTATAANLSLTSFLVWVGTSTASTCRLWRSSTTVSTPWWPSGRCTTMRLSWITCIAGKVPDRPRRAVSAWSP